MKRSAVQQSMNVVACVFAGLAALEARAAELGALRAGAARVDITPAEGTPIRMSGYGGRTDPFEGIHDRLYTRAVVVDDGEHQAAIVTGDLIGIGNDLWQTVTQRIAD